MFGQTSNEGRLQAGLPGGFQIAVVCGNHHHFLRDEPEGRAGRQIDRGLGFVVVGDLGPENAVPRQATVLRKPGHQGNRAIRTGCNDVVELQSFLEAAYDPAS